MASAMMSTAVNYLKSYPYLFVRETDQTDYFCTICDTYLKEDELQTHLFEGHQAENLNDFFVRVCAETANKGYFLQKKFLYICVVCWAKINSIQDMASHRASCKVNPSENGENIIEDGASPPTTDDPVTRVVSTPDIPNFDELNDTDKSPPPDFPHPEVLISEDVRPKKKGRHMDDLHFSSQCIQCSLCTMVLPSPAYLQHLRVFHRVTCPLEHTSCPLCVMSVPIMDLTIHLASAHGIVPQSAVNAILLWVLSSNTFALNTKAKESLQSKFRGGGGDLPSIPPNSIMEDTKKHLPNGSSPAPILSAFLQPPTTPNGDAAHADSKVPLEKVVSKLTRRHVGPVDEKESFQCLLCSKWFAVPPVKHMRGHILKLKEEKRRIAPLLGGSHVCLICYATFDSQHIASSHMATHNLDDAISNAGGSAVDDLPMGATYETVTKETSKKTNGKSNINPRGVELDNAGRVKSGKVRKQCELCGEWSNIKWFFKHMSEVHQALFCRCCREYLPIPEHEEHRKWHQEPPYMGQKIRIENGHPIIIDRKERASLTPIGSLAPWGGSSGGLVVKAVDDGKPARKRKSNGTNDAEAKKMAAGGPLMVGHMVDFRTASSTAGSSSASGSKETLMPKETCPVCGILITYKNLARHIKLRHKIKYKFCHKCRKLVPNSTYEAHKEAHDRNEVPLNDSGSIDLPADMKDDVLETGDGFYDNNSITDTSLVDQIAEDEDGHHGDARKSESFRANTSKTKLESLVGKEFKHPRRRCAICGYSVSYSNFKRHLRNAHPSEYKKCENNPAAYKRALQTLALADEALNASADFGHHFMHPMDMDDDSVQLPGMPVECELDEGNDSGDNAFTECSYCGDHVVTEFLERHIQNNHTAPPDGDAERMCPVCGEEADDVIGHCKEEHETEFVWCTQCSKFVLDKFFASHERDHASDHASEIPDDDDAPDEASKHTKVYNCTKCNHMFLAEEAYNNHVRDSHEGETEKIDQVD